jgi:DNA polymerase
MSNAYQELLDATIRHLQELKIRGVHFVSVSEETLKALSETPKPGAPKIPTPSSTSQSSLRDKPFDKPAASTKPPVTAKPLEQSLSLGLLGEAVPPPSSAPLSPEAKAAAFADLRTRAMACVKCRHLADSRKNVVFGVGSTDAQLMFVGEAPGADEDTQGEPFVGRAGQLLTRIIETMGLTRDSVYIANILKCRPDTPGQATGNRKPTSEEMQTCIPYLHEQIDLIRPKVLVALGGTAVEGLLGKTAGIMRLRGHWQTYRGTPLMPTYHPAYLLRNAAPAEKRCVWEDMLQVMEKLGMPISEKQRKFFLKESS